MKFFTLPLLAALLLTACAPATPTYTPPVKLTPLRVAVFPEVEKFAQPGQTPNSVQGFEADLFNAIAAQAGWQVEWVPLAGETLLAATLSQCSVDAAISSLPIQDAPGWVFSDPYYETSLALVVQQSNPRIASLTDLSGMRVGLQTGSPAQAFAQTSSGWQVESYETTYLTFKELMDGYVDAVITDLPRARTYANIKPNQLKIIAENLLPVQFGIAVCPQQPQTLKAINAALEQLQQNGELTALKQTWGLSETP